MEEEVSDKQNYSATISDSKKGRSFHNGTSFSLGAKAIQNYH